MKVYVWYWATLLLWAVEGIAECPDGYQMHGRICYKAFDRRKAFLKASKTCSDEGGTLAMPKDANTNAFLISLKNDVDSNREFWFGLVDHHQEGDWEWIDGTPIGNYNAWGHGESDNHEDKDCVEYSTTTWNVEQCSEDRGFICQIIQAGCPDGYVYHEPSRVCYKAYNDRKDYDGAVATCFTDGGNLALPRDNVTNKFLINLKNAVDNTRCFRFGLTDLQQEGTWMWADNVTLGNFTAWGPGEPNNDNDEDCAEYFPGNHHTNKNKWHDGACSEDDRFICQVMPTGCPSGYRMHEGICYKAFNMENNFLDASETCSDEGGTLAMPKDANTNAFLTSLKSYVKSNDPFWFGLVDQHEEGAWEWIDGTPIGKYSNWKEGEPNNLRNEDCVEYSLTKWNDQKCSEGNRFICQIILAGCPDDYVYHEPSRVCYRAFDEERNYDGAVDACSSDNGTLAIPRDNVTNKFLINLKNAVDIDEWFRFGLTDVQQEGTWLWADNVTLGSFDAWGPGEPNSYGNQEEDCAEYFPGYLDTKKNTWNDGPCSVDDRKFICQVIPTDDSTTVTVPSVGTEMLSHSTWRVTELSFSTSTIKPEMTTNTGAEQKIPPWVIGVICAVMAVITIIAVVTVLLYRRKHNPGATMPGKRGSEMTNLGTPDRHDHTASEGSVDNIIYNTEDEGFVDNVIYNAGDDGTVDNVIYQGEDSTPNNPENAAESQYESVN
ncbi:MRC1 [Branchiostoma lanceolatum]|uniref:MRC1 protein n=1 Tax=Branchiostoma lanceolatum TaxID=7740 RepID=A0A8J9ZWF4_BRALA|nr:MRC1 [Branchiostoma lanceolatum]